MKLEKNSIFCIVAAHMIAFTYGSSRRDIINNAPQLAEKRKLLFLILSESRWELRTVVLRMDVI